MDEQLRSDLAGRLGMKTREVIAIVPTVDGHVVTTHDGYRTLVRADGSLEHGVPEPAGAPEPSRPAIRTTATVGRAKKG
jgi:hypothetical protein